MVTAASWETVSRGISGHLLSSLSLRGIPAVYGVTVLQDKKNEKKKKSILQSKKKKKKEKNWKEEHIKFVSGFMGRANWTVSSILALPGSNPSCKGSGVRRI